MSRSASRILVLGLTLPTLLVAAPNLPTPPEGFSWKRIEDVHATFLMPDGWYFKSEANRGTLAYFLTAEKIKRGGRFETGLTINVFKNLKDKDAVAYAEAFTTEAGRQHEALERWQLNVGAFHGFGVITRQVAHDEVPPLVIGYLVIGNDRTNTMYLLWFESLESTWKTAWEKGDKMLHQFSLDDEF